MKKKLISYVAGAVLLLALWQTLYMVLDNMVMPAPWPVFQAVPGLFATGMVGHLGHSLLRVFVALCISMGVGLLLGILAAGKGLVGRGLTAFLYFTYPMPRVALLPVVLVIFGLTNTAKIIMVALIIVYPIVVIVRDAIRDIPPTMTNGLVCYGAGRLQLFWHVTLPWALTAVFSTLRISLGTSFSVLFFVETYGTRQGMGFFIQDTWMRLQYVDMFAGMVVLSLAGFGLFLVVDIVESILLKWKG